MPNAPTTEGSIVAYLRLDASDWNETLDRAEAKARELAQIDPTVRVNADTAEALAQLEAVKEAEDRVGGTTTTTSKVNTVKSSSASSSGTSAAAQAAKQLAAAETALEVAIRRRDSAQRQAENAASTAYIADLRLVEIQDKRGRTELQLAVAEEANARAARNAEAAELRYAAANQAAADAEKHVAEAALAAAAAQEVEAAASDKAGKSAAGNASYMGMVVAAVVASIPLLGSMTGAAFALGGGLTMMGGAGVLAVLGIKNEMSQATDAGVQFSAGIAAVKDEVTALEETAANSMLPAFGKSLSDIEQQMPNLNTEVSQFSRLLGTGVETTLEGVLNLLRLGNPLFVEAGQLVDRVGVGFLKWTTDGGLTKFIAYSERELPIVMNTLGELGGTVEHVVEAFAPVGSEVLVTIGAVSHVINQIPLPVLMTLGTFAATAFGAFKLWGGIAPIISKVSTALFGVGVAEEAAMGPVGLVAAGVTGLVAIFSSVAGAQQNATQAANDYAQALEADNYAIGQNTTALLAKQLHDSSQLQMAHELGISTTTYTQAVMGNKDALDQVNAKIAAGQQQYPAYLLSSRAATQSSKDHAVAARDLKGKLDDQIKSMEAGTTTADAYQAAQLAANGAVADGVSLAQKETDAQNKAKTATDQFAQALAGLGNVNLAEAQANVAWNQSIADASTALQKNGATLDQNTQKGRDNTSALDNMASSAIALISAHAKAGVSAQALTGDMQAARDSFVQTAMKMGDTAAQANALADQYGLIPKDVSTAYHDSGLQQANSEVSALQAQLDAIERPFTIPVHIVTSGTMPTAGHLAAQSGGGPVVQYRAAGGAIDSLFRPIGTDTVPTMLTPEEFVVKRSSAKHDPGFIRAYNDNPAAALAAVRASGSPSERPIYADGIGLIGWMREVAGQAAQLVWNTGMNQAAQETIGGLV
ncbi:hypothetical protein [Leifsonia sp. P73]|uniref:hypothetical protein n=1 Tax=Leifsonia sp. P73 TaxID=3423959 RepID=UPI003DA5687B